MNKQKHSTPFWQFGIAVLVLALGAFWLAQSWPQNRPQTATQVATNYQSRVGDTNLTLASFNLLGASHTDRVNSKYPNSAKRMSKAVNYIRARGLSVVGFQEFEYPQLQKFRELVGETWGVWPGAQLNRRYFPNPIANSIVWDTKVWTAVSKKTMFIPYFDGKKATQPYVMLQNNVTGSKIWVYNTHHPADVHGDAAQWRLESIRREVALIKELRTANPNIPVFITGDMNDREAYFCKMMAWTNLHASAGGGMDGKKCVPPKPTNIDWVMATPEVNFTRAVTDWSGKKELITDHPIIITQATLPPQGYHPTQRVVVIAINGLNSTALAKQAGQAATPQLREILTTAASTQNARTMVENANLSSNLMSAASGKFIALSNKGHGVTSPNSPNPTLPSIFSRVHDAGFSTMFASSNNQSNLLATNTWASASGPNDPIAVDNGVNKISTLLTASTDAELVKQINKEFYTNRPRLSFVVLGDLARAGERFGWNSREYFTALAATDQLIGTIVQRINNLAKYRGKTRLIITSAKGGPARNRSETDHRFFTIPLVVTGPGIANSDLYTLNPGLLSPGYSQPTYASGRVIRINDVANLVATALLLPPVYGSQYPALATKLP